MSENARCPECGQFRPAHKYWIDWEDQHYPAIRVYEHDFGAEGNYPYAPEPLTLAQAKTAIIEHFTHMREHAQARIAEARKVRTADFRKEAGTDV